MRSGKASGTPSWGYYTAFFVVYPLDVLGDGSARERPPSRRRHPMAIFHWDIRRVAVDGSA
jgi:hypothetical protein